MVKGERIAFLLFAYEEGVGIKKEKYKLSTPD